jgi:hypothetical protein
MPLFTVLNPTDAQVAGNGGPYPAFSRKTGVDLNNNQAGSLVASGLILTPDGATPGGVARSAFALLATLTPGLATAAQREGYRLKAGQQEWQDLLRLLRSVD